MPSYLNMLGLIYFFTQIFYGGFYNNFLSMSRVVKSVSDVKLTEAAEACPMSCFRREENSFVINPEECIDCGVCQTVVDEGVIIDDTEADETAINFNREKSEKWQPAK
jgi:NAD-dependent dihydropyrimidine dehydrogenase PreA subunit